jgi:hypothetical protein
MKDEEAAWRAISDAEEELRTQEAQAVQYEPDDLSIPEVAITRLMERGMLTREEAGALVVEWLGSPEGIDYHLHAIAKQNGLLLLPHNPCFHPDV